MYSRVLLVVVHIAVVFTSSCECQGTLNLDIHIHGIDSVIDLLQVIDQDINFGIIITPDDGIMISIGERVIPNHGLVATQDIGVDPNGANLTSGLKCSTTYDMCCSDSTRTTSTRGGQSPSGSGSWLYAHFPTNPYIVRQIDSVSNTFGIRRNENAVYLFRNKMSAPPAADGIWRCDIPDSSGTEQTKYIGVYSSNSNG